MSRYTKTNSLALSLLVLFLVNIPPIVQGDEPLIQADVYNALFDAYVQCDDDLDLSRSEFITEKLEGDGGRGMSIELLRKLFTHNVQTANQSIADKEKKRELLVSKILGAGKKESDQSIDSDEVLKEFYKEIRQNDDLIQVEKGYIQVHVCVLSVL